MPKHTPTDDAVARTLVENQLAAVIKDAGFGGSGDSTLSHDIARAVVRSFEFVEMDTARSNVPGGTKVNLRRPVLTGSWEVDPNAPAKATETP